MEELVRKRRFHFCNLYSGFVNLIVFAEAQQGNKVDRVRCLCTGCFLLTVARLSHNLHMNQGSHHIVFLCDRMPEGCFVVLSHNLKLDLRNRFL